LTICTFHYCTIYSIAQQTEKGAKYFHLAYKALFKTNFKWFLIILFEKIYYVYHHQIWNFFYHFWVIRFKTKLRIFYLKCCQ